MASVGMGLSASYGAVLVDLDATGLTPGPLPVWANTGITSGDFTAVATIPEVISVDGVKGVAFQGNTPGSGGTSYVGPVAPDSVCFGGSRTIETWVWDPSSQDEKTVFAWGRRGGPDGSNCTFGHGSHATWGGLGGWGYADIGYTNIVFSRWTYIVYTYDSTTMTARLYKDGVLNNTETYTTPLNTWNTANTSAPIPFRVARQTESNGDISGSGVGTNIIAKIRIQDTAIDSAAVQAQYDAEKTQFGLVDSDNDGIPTWWELRHGLNPDDASDAGGDLDADGSTNLQEYQQGTKVDVADTDRDGLLDGVETKTGVWSSQTNTGTDPLKADTDGDSLLDGVESNSGVYVGTTDTGTSPLKKDTDSDGWNDPDEIFLGSNPNDVLTVPTAASWAEAVSKSNPKYWYRFEESDPAQPAANSGSATAFQGAYGPGITAENLSKPSALPSLGTAIEFTGPVANNATTKYVDMAASVPAEMTTPNIPELVNLRPPSVDKVTTVEYWFKTTQRGTHGNNSWQSPAIIARESPGDGDMYWGKINDQGEFGFSTSDINDVLTRRDMGKNVTDGQWHHLVMIKEWHTNQSCVSTMYIDGGPQQPGGASFTKTTAAGNASYQDADSLIRYIGFTQNGELENVQYIGLLDEVVIYDRGLSEAEVRLHSQAVRGADTDEDGLPDIYELDNGFDPNDPTDATLDADNDGATNVSEYRNHTDLNNADTDGDGLLDGVETATGVWVSATDTGTDPLNSDTDGDRLLDGDESSAGTDPNKRDTDADGFTDADEALLGTNPVSPDSKPVTPESWSAAVMADNPVHWLSFEEYTTADSAANYGSAGFDFMVTYGHGIVDNDLSKESAHPNLGMALELTGPEASAAAAKYVDFGKAIPELINLRQDAAGAAIAIADGKATTVEYWFKTSIRGSNGNDTWRNPSIFAHESGGDGDMYWGNFNQNGDFIFSTSDLHDAHITNGYATDGKWHHVVMSKIWYANGACISRLYMDGGALCGGKTIETTTPAGAPSGQDNDSEIRYLGFTQNGEGSNTQFIGLIDEVAIYNTAFVEAQARLHFLAGGGTPPGETAVTLHYQKSGSDMIMSWSQGVLQSAADVNGPWSPVENATSPYTIPVDGARKFFRVLVP